MTHMRIPAVSAALLLGLCAPVPSAFSQGLGDMPGISDEAPAPNPAKKAGRKSARKGGKDEPLVGCSAPLAALAEAYREAYEEFMGWARERSGEVSAVFAKEKAIKDKIQANGAKMNELKFEGGRAAKKKIKLLKRENKKLWKDLKGMAKEKRAACKGLSKKTSRKFKELDRKLGERFKAVMRKLD